jgi:hypothetical protein
MYYGDTIKELEGFYGISRGNFLSPTAIFRL